MYVFASDQTSRIYSVVLNFHFYSADVSSGISVLTDNFTVYYNINMIIIYDILKHNTAMDKNM